jgi:hypothetical protein
MTTFLDGKTVKMKTVKTAKLKNAWRPLSHAYGLMKLKASYFSKKKRKQLITLFAFH